jgi:hypothetical protein
MSALAIDYGMIKSAKAEGQRAMDAAALAGAAAFLRPDDPTISKPALADELAREYAAKHTVRRVAIDPKEPPEGTVHVEVDADKQQVTASYTSPGFQLWFARIFGTETMGINASATAEAAVEGKTVDCVKPFLLPDMWNESDDANEDNDPTDNIWGPEEAWEFNPDGGGDEYVPYDPTASSSTQTGFGSDLRNGNGDYGLPMLIKPQTGNPATGGIARTGMMFWLMDLAPKENTRDEIGLCTSMAVGEEAPIDVEPGSKTGQVTQGVGDLIALDPDATWDPVSNTVVGSQPPPESSISPEDWDWTQSPRVITVALFDPTFIKDGDNPGGGSSVVITNFARVFLEEAVETDEGGTPNVNVTGRFVGSAIGGPTGEETGALVKFLRLIK